MSKVEKSVAVSIETSAPQWANKLETISNQIEEVSEGLVEAMIRHLPIVVPFETKILVKIRDSLDELITQMRAACGDSNAAR